MARSYEEEADRLAGLPRAERFEALLQFPTRHTFKVIGKSEGFYQVLLGVLASTGFAEVLPVERPSAKGNYVSITFTLEVTSGRHLDEIYLTLERLPGLAFIL